MGAKYLRRKKEGPFVNNSKKVNGEIYLTMNIFKPVLVRDSGV